MDRMIQTPGRNPVASSPLENFMANESCPFSSSLSDFFTRKVKLSTNDILSHRYTDTLASYYEVKEPFVSTKDNVEQTIGSLLPDEDDLFSGMIDEFGFTAHANRSSVEEDFDLFSSSGGMELDVHYSIPKDYPSEKYFNQGTLLVFNLDSSVSNDELHQTFGCFGDIKKIHETSDKRNYRFIEYYDSRAAEAALHALNKTDINIGGRWIKFELRYPWDAKRCLMQQFSPDPLQDELIPCPILSDESSVECIGTNGMHIHTVDSNGHSADHHVFGSSGGGSFPLHGHCHVWSTSNSLQHHLLSPMVWMNSPTHFNGIHAHSTPKFPLLSKAPSHVLNTHQHHIGSAPAIDTFRCDTQHAHKGGSPEAFGFHLKSVGSVGFSENSSMLNLSNCMDKPANFAQCSPQHNCNVLPRRNAVTSAPTSFATSNNRMRNLSHRRIEADSGHTDKKKYELDIDRVSRGEDNRTTLMIKNIPNKYSSKLLMAAIDEHHRGTYDFLYLPIDFKNNCNMGYAFINMIDSLQIIPFHKTFNGKKWEKFYSEKVAYLAYARIQGKAALIAHFQNSSLMNEDKRCRPIVFHNDGSNACDQEPCPMGTRLRSRP